MLFRSATAVHRAVETAQPAVDANGHVLELTLPTGPVRVEGDLIRLAQVVSNLITNAAKYSTRPGRIRVRLAEEEGEAVVEVADEGQGIAPDLLARIFDLFVQGMHSPARSQGGLGIGLTLVRRLVEMHGGRVQAQSGGPGQGSTFTVCLPLAPAEAAARDEGGAAPGSGLPIPRRVLVVDDNVDAANGIAAVLKLFGHKVHCVYDGPAALVAAEEFRPEVVVLDIGLPGMDGYEVARNLRSRAEFRRTPIVAVTGYGQDEDRRLSREAGFDQHLTKPVDAEVLLQLVATR